MSKRSWNCDSAGGRPWVLFFVMELWGVPGDGIWLDGIFGEMEIGKKCDLSFLEDFFEFFIGLRVENLSEALKIAPWGERVRTITFAVNQ